MPSPPRLSRACALLVSAFALFLGAAAEAQEATARLVPVAQSSGPTGPFAHYRPLRIPLSERAQETLVKEPEYRSARPLYGALPLGNGSDRIVTIVLDEPEEGKVSYFYVDANNDNDLTNDDGGEWPKGNATNFIRDQDLQVRYAADGGGEVTAPFFIRFYRFRDFSTRAELRDKVLCYRANHREGTIELEGKTYRLCIADDDVDGVFDDLESTGFALDADGDGQLDGDPRKSAEGRLASEPFTAGGRNWKVKSISPAGDTVVVVATTEEVPARPPAGAGQDGTATGPGTAGGSVGPEAPPGGAGGATPGGNDAGTPGGGPTPARGPELAELRERYQKERTHPAAQRNAAIQAIGQLRTRDSAEFLRWAFSAESDPAVRSYLASALGVNGTPEAFRALVAGYAMTADAAGARAAVVRALGSFRSVEAFQRVVGAYKDARKDPSIRLAAVQAMRNFGGPEFDPEVDRFFFEVLPDDYGPVLAEALRHLAPTKDRRVVAAAREALAKNPTATVRQAALEPLKHVGGHETFVLIFEAAGREMDEVTKRAMIDALLTFDDPATRKWVQAQGLGHKDAGLRRVAVALLGRTRDRTMLKTLLRALRDPDSGVRLEAVDALVELGAREAEADLLQIAGGDDPELASAAIEALGAVEQPSPEVARRLLALLRSRRAEVVLAAANSLGRLRVPEALAPLVSLLDHEAWQVRAGTVEALVRLRRKEAIPALIARLGREDGRLRHDVATALRRLTGQNLGADPNVWQRWWDDHGAAFHLPPVEAEEIAQEEGETKYYGIPVVSKRICFLLDISGSMSAAQPMPGTHAENEKNKTTRLDVAKKELADTLDRLPRDVRFNLVFFDDRQEPWEKSLRAGDPAARLEAKKFLDRQVPRGGTNIYDSIELALMDKEVDTLFLLSDGAPGAGKFVQPGDILREVRKLNRSRKVVIHTICIGSASRLMQDLAKQNGGISVQR